MAQGDQSVLQPFLGDRDVVKGTQGKPTHPLKLNTGSSCFLGGQGPVHLLLPPPAVLERGR